MRAASSDYCRQINKNRKLFTKAGILLFLLLILFFPSASYNGAKRGLLLWFNTVLPTLLPFIIVSNLIIRMQITRPLGRLFYPLFHFLFGVSKGGCYPVLIGFLSGIPVGAKSVSDLVENKSISLEEGQFLLSFCNNASPMFIVSFVALSQLGQEKLRLPLLVILYLSAVLASLLYFRILRLPAVWGKQNRIGVQSVDSSEAVYTRFDFALLDSAIMDGFEVITKVGGYIILFSIPVQIMIQLNTDNSLWKLLAISLLEITTGVNQISQAPLAADIKIALVAMITAFGGLSGLAQTKSVISNTRLSIGIYFIVKCINMGLVFLITCLYVHFFL